MKTLYKSFILALLMLISTNAFAGGVVSVNSSNKVNFTPGKTASLDINLTNTDEAIACLSFTLVLPKGATIGAEKKDINITFNRNISSSYEVGIEENADGNYYYFYFESSAVSGKEGCILSMEVSFADDFEGGEGKIEDILIAGDEEDAPESVTFTFEEATAETETITLGNSDSYNTYVSEKDLDFTGFADAEAYVVTAVSKTEATLTKVDAVPAGEGFMILGKGKSEIEVPVAAEKPAATGTLLATGQPSEGDYLLAKDGSEFVLWNGEGTLASTKAYLPATAITAGAKVITFAFGESTGINEIQKAETEGAIYNLSGMRVSKTQKGVYIMNGRKVIVK